MRPGFQMRTSGAIFGRMRTRVRAVVPGAPKTTSTSSPVTPARASGGCRTSTGGSGSTVELSRNAAISCRLATSVETCLPPSKATSAYSAFCAPLASFHHATCTNVVTGSPSAACARVSATCRPERFAALQPAITSGSDQVASSASVVRRMSSPSSPLRCQTTTSCCDATSQAMRGWVSMAASSVPGTRSVFVSSPFRTVSCRRGSSASAAIT
jgi:hypothetical protein